MPALAIGVRQHDATERAWRKGHGNDGGKKPHGGRSQYGQ